MNVWVKEWLELKLSAVDECFNVYPLKFKLWVCFLYMRTHQINQNNILFLQ